MQMPASWYCQSEYLPEQALDAKERLLALVPADQRKRYIHPGALARWTLWCRISQGCPAPIAADIQLSGAIRVRWARDNARLSLLFDHSEACAIAFEGFCSLSQAYVCLLTEIGEKDLEHITFA